MEKLKKIKPRRNTEGKRTINNEQGTMKNGDPRSLAASTNPLAFVHYYLFIVLCLLFSLLFGCFSPWTGGGTAITLNLGRGNSRAVVDDTILNALEYTIVLTGPTEIKTLNHTGAGTVSSTVDPGNWNIDVTAYLYNELYARGSEDTVIKAGKNNAVTVYMTILDQIYEIGDTGPGGGKIFYVSEAGFTVEGYNGTIGSFSTYTAHYLEAAPDGWYGDPSDPGDPGISWAEYSSSPTSSYVDVPGTETAIGTGRNNTLLMLASGDTPAAEACNDYENNGKKDWFLPSIDELNQLYVNREYAGDFQDSNYFSSSQNSSNDPAGTQGADIKNFENGVQGVWVKDYQANIRPIRAF